MVTRQEVDHNPPGRHLATTVQPPGAFASGQTLIYRSTVRHLRKSTVTREFSYSGYYWLIDVDHLPRIARLLRPFARFHARDHLGDPAGTLSGNVRGYLADHGVEADRVRLLTSPRVAGHAFNPLSVFYCDLRGEQVAVIAEVHNTYGGRHVYLLRPDGAGRDRVDKAFYVSPFLPMGGQYLMRTPPPGDELHVSIALRIADRTPFVATLTGSGRLATTGTISAALLRWPFVTLRTSALIRWQGLRLWLRGIPVQTRPPDATGPETAR